jgi:hypothetical protein
MEGMLTGDVRGKLDADGVSRKDEDATPGIPEGLHIEEIGQSRAKRETKTRLTRIAKAEIIFTKGGLQ